jgi:hypothetical protein
MAGFIEYSGILKDLNNMNQFVEEVSDVSKIMKWDFEIFDNGLQGICFTPPDCDAIIFTIDEAGFITNPMQRQMPNNGDIKIIKVEINLTEEDIKPKITEGNAAEISQKMNEMAHQIIIKTDYETDEEDQKLITFLNYIGGKYFDDFELEFTKNESTDDDFPDFEPIEMLQAMISKFTQQLDKSVIKPNESIMDFIKRIMKDKGI